MALAAISTPALHAVPRRSLGDKLQLLAVAAPEKVKAIERIVDFLLACVIFSQSS